MKTRNKHNIAPGYYWATDNGELTIIQVDKDFDVYILGSDEVGKIPDFDNYVKIVVPTSLKVFCQED